VKNFKGTVCCARDFPYKIKELLPILELLTPTNRHFSKLQSFIEMKFPDEGFPLKLEIPIVPTVTGVVTFTKFERQIVDSSLFEIPSNYTPSEIKFFFDFLKSTPNNI